MQARLPILRLALVAVACFASASLASAEVDYVRDLTFPFGPPPSGSVLPYTKAPIDTSDPLYDPDLPDTQRIVVHSVPLIGRYSSYTFDPATGIVSAPKTHPLVKVDQNALTAQSGVGTSDSVLQIIGIRNELFRFGLQYHARIGDPVLVPMAVVSSLAMADRTNLTAIETWGSASGPYFNGLYSIDITTGEIILELAFSGGTAPGEFSMETLHHLYGPDGLVYLLDYGNDRMQMLDPANSFAFVSEFALETSVTTANMQFAIGTTGNIYLGDGLGGGSYYSATGGFLGSFALDTPVDPTLDIGTPYLSTDATGGVYVFDDTGFHQYRDLSVVPEPATWGLVLGAGIWLYAWGRRRFRA